MQSIMAYIFQISFRFYELMSFTLVYSYEECELVNVFRGYFSEAMIFSIALLVE